MTVLKYVILVCVCLCACLCGMTGWSGAFILTACDAAKSQKPLVNRGMDNHWTGWAGSCMGEKGAGLFQEKRTQPGQRKMERCHFSRRGHPGGPAPERLVCRQRKNSSVGRTRTPLRWA